MTTLYNAKRWQKLEALLAVNNPVVLEGLRPPASLASIREAENELGMVLPTDIREAYLRHDGTSLVHPDLGRRVIMPASASWLPLDELVKTAKSDESMFHDFAAEGYEGYLKRMHEYPGDRVRKWGPLPEWIRIGSGPSVGIYIDLAPGPAGVMGQMVQHDFGGGSVFIAESFGAYLDLLIASLANGTGGWPDGPTRWLALGHASAEELASVTQLDATTNCDAMPMLTGYSPSPTIDFQPQAATVNAGSSATFTVSATGDGELHYQWLRNGIGIPGAETPQVQIAADAAGIGKTFQITVEVSNAAGMTTSQPALMTVTHPIGGVSVEELVDAAAGCRIVTRRRAGLTVPPGALIANARVRLVCEQADRLGIASEFIPIGDAITLDTGGVEFSQALELEVAWSFDADGDKVLGLLELGETVAVRGDDTAASTPVIRVLGLSAQHGGYGSVIVGLDRPGRYLLAQVPESSITDELA